MQILYICSDFDEHELETKVYSSVERFVEDRIGIAYSITQLEEISEDCNNVDERFVLQLLREGSVVGEWHTEEVWVISGDQFVQGIL